MDSWKERIKQELAIQVALSPVQPVINLVLAAAFSGVIYLFTTYNAWWWPWVALATIGVFVSVISALGYHKHGPVRRSRRMMGWGLLVLAGILLLGALVSGFAGYNILWGKKEQLALAPAPTPPLAEPIQPPAASGQAPPKAVEQAPTKPFYSTGELELILTALRELQQVIDGKAETARQDAWELSQHWDGFLRSHGPQATIERLTRIKTGALESSDEIKKILSDNDYFSEHLGPTVEGYMNTEIVGTANTLIQDLQRLQNNSPEDISRFSQASYEKWHATIQPYEGWVNESRRRIYEKTKEIRTWNEVKQ